VVTLYNGIEKTVHSWTAIQIGTNPPRSDDPDSEVADAKWFDIDNLPHIHLYQRALIDEVKVILGEDHGQQNAGRKSS
jgi:hypothetical protein